MTIIAKRLMVTKMKPPFFGTKILDSIKFSDIEPLIDRDALFAGRWQLRQGLGAKEWEEFVRSKAAPIFDRMISLCSANSILIPKIVYGYFECRQDGNGLVVTRNNRSFRFDFPREMASPNRCLADFFPDGFAAMQVATIGGRVAEYAAGLFAKSAYADTFYLKGLAAEAAEAAAKFGHRHIRNELGIAEDTGGRFSPGYPAFPDLMSQKKIFALLEPKRIGVQLTETCHMVPEYSTSAIISIDPKACYFRP